MSKLPVNKEVNLDSYTTLEMTCLMQDILKEVQARKKMAYIATSEFDKIVSEVYHDIELNEFTKKEKIEKFDKLQLILNKRRMVKRELWSLKNINERIGISALLGDTNKAIKHMQAYLKVEDKQSLHIKKGEFTRFYKDAKEMVANKA